MPTNRKLCSRGLTVGFIHTQIRTTSQNMLDGLTAQLGTGQTMKNKINSRLTQVGLKPSTTVVKGETSTADDDNTGESNTGESGGTPPPSSPPPSQQPPSENLSLQEQLEQEANRPDGGLIGGVAAGGAALVSLVGYVIYYFAEKKKKENTALEIEAAVEKRKTMEGKSVVYYAISTATWCRFNLIRRT